MGERKAIEQVEIKKKKRKFIVFVIIFFILVVLPLLLQYVSKQYLEDPFECATIKFMGINGEGKIKIEDSNKCDYFSDINYNPSRIESLKEGEKIRITVSSDLYRFGVKSKEYIVEGLSLYLNDLNDLDETRIKKIHDISYNYLKNNLGTTFTGEIVELSSYKMFLYTDEEYDNVLYDVYKISVKTKSNNIYDKFVVACYEKFVLYDNENLFNYSDLKKCGESIKAGDKNASWGSKDYVGLIKGFENIEDFRNYINKNNNGSFTLKEK